MQNDGGSELGDSQGDKSKIDKKSKAFARFAVVPHSENPEEEYDTAKARITNLREIKDNKLKTSKVA